MTRRLATCWCCLLAPLALAGQAWAADPGPVPGPVPQELIESAATRMLQALDADREAARKDPKRVQKMVDEILLPAFDTD